MTNVVDFPGARTTISDAEFKEAILAAETNRRVSAALGEYLNEPRTAFTLDAKVVHPTAKIKFGTVYHPVRHSKILAVSGEFPEVLCADAGLTRGEALNVAADFANVFHLVGQGVMRAGRGINKPQGRNFDGSLRADIWAPEYVYENGARLAMPYRAAAMIALAGQGLEVITLDNVSPPYPGHIAALQNPLTDQQFRSLKALIEPALV